MRFAATEPQDKIGKCYKSRESAPQHVSHSRCFSCGFGAARMSPELKRKTVAAIIRASFGAVIVSEAIVSIIEAANYLYPGLFIECPTKEPRGALKLLLEINFGAVTEARDEFTGCVGICLRVWGLEAGSDRGVGGTTDQRCRVVAGAAV